MDLQKQVEEQGKLIAELRARVDAQSQAFGTLANILTTLRTLEAADAVAIAASCKALENDQSFRNELVRRYELRMVKILNSEKESEISINQYREYVSELLPDHLRSLIA